jgi:superfamily II DNA or RNA helicase
MTISEYLSLYGKKMGYLETTFLRNVYYEDYGEAGLDFIEPEVEIDRNDGTDKKWRLDFVVTTKKRKYVIECDGFNYHAAGMVSRERFNELESKRNETINQGYRLISLSKDQIIDNPNEAIYELRREFNADKDLYSLFLHWNSGRIEPHDVQKKALSALESTRKNNKKRGLVVLATGLGKTYLSIFDAKAMEAKNILFIVHVDHILKQAKNSFEKVMPERSKDMGFFTGKEKNFKGKNIVFSTIQTINKESNLSQFPKDYFDYIIIDESHHVAAPSYRKVVEYFEPKFFLGLTATPDRMDEKDILEFYDNNLVFEMGQSEAIRQGYLANLNYKGFKDDVDYSNIYYNGFRYDVDDLNKALMIERRDKAIIDKFKDLAKNKKTIAFCVSIEHADWSAEQFRKAGINAVSIHSKIENKNTDGAYQSASEIIDAFDKGKHQVAFVVDMLNEGIDIPDVECLLMLRPTESNAILTQQIGRGLRIAENKDEVLVLDFIGNYQTAPMVLSGLGIRNVGDMIEDKEKGIYFYENEGRRVEFQSEVVDIFKFMISRSSSKVRDNLISDEWKTYGDYLEINTKAGANLFWSVGKKNNNLSTHLWALNYIITNKDKFANNEEISEGLKRESIKVSPLATMEGIRALFFSKLIGLVVETNPFGLSPAYYEIYKFINKGEEKKAWSIISDQIEKFYFYNDISGLFDRHTQQGEKRKVDELFHVYPIFFIYQVLLRLREKGYEDGRLSKFEIDNFILLNRTHGDVGECVDRIVSYREYDEKYELEKYLNQKSTMDSRFFKILKYIRFFSFSRDSITLKNEHVIDIEQKVNDFNLLSENGKLIQFNKDNPLIYRKMLYSEKDIISYHSKPLK